MAVSSQQGAGLAIVIPIHREGKIGGAIPMVFCTIMSTSMLASLIGFRI